MPAKSTLTVEERFWSHVRIIDDEYSCWEWVAYRNARGYGRFGITPYDIQLTHRISYRFAYGDFPDEMYVLHKCDNPPCVRPTHLFLGTQTDNIRDAIQKKRRHIVLDTGK